MLAASAAEGCCSPRCALMQTRFPCHLLLSNEDANCYLLAKDLGSLKRFSETNLEFSESEQSPLLWFHKTNGITRRGLFMDF